MKTLAYCYRGGLIEFTHAPVRLPDGTIPILSHEDGDALRGAVNGLARHAYPPDDYIMVPGLPEAVDEAAALAALTNFRRHVAAALEVSE